MVGLAWSLWLFYVNLCLPEGRRGKELSKETHRLSGGALISCYSKQIFTETELCTRYFPSCWGYKKTNKNEGLPAFLELAA